MPQMMPLLWSLTLTYSIMMLFLLTMFNYFFYMPTFNPPSPSLLYSNNQNIKWNWKW